ncbi:translation initiation factor eIF-2 beta subunit [Tieghemiomyces parasiticus]|uniref:Translation initiation factor eIF-2 beta subunit n=1 Tax=Tieghemiomyces parasiticus TaxID=78921 RepID=A0A9W8AEQ2_9FUNG|nr:translation initiation factor eIF-2 beta subunit [Tieghemiomyces parasiticus]
MADSSELTQKLEQTHLDDAPAEEASEALFDLSMKKKKKKKKVDLDDLDTADATPTAEETTAPAEEDPSSLFADLKKKKKKKAKVPLDLGEGEAAGEAQTEDSAAAAGNAEALDFSDLKKKKKKTKKVDFAAFEAELKDSGDHDGQDDMFGSGDEGGDHAGSGNAGGDPWAGSNRDYTYPELLGRFFKILRANNPELAGEKKRYTIAPPQVAREGNKKTIFANVADIAKRMHRQPDHVTQFLFAELGTSGSVDGSQRLVIKGRFSQKQIENVLRRYIMEYVTCKTCKSPDTILTKENRLFFLQCESCGSTRSVSAIKTGFQAQTVRRAVARRAAE